MSHRYPKIAPGEVLIGFSTGRRWNPLSALIRVVTSSVCSHTWLLYHDERLGMPMVMEAHYEFRLIPYERFVLDNKIVDLVHPSWDLSKGLRDTAYWLGAYYDVGGLLGMFPVMIGRWVKHHWRHLKLRWHNALESKRGLFCAEAVVRALHASGCPGSWQLAATESSPQDILDFFLANNAPREPVA